MDFCHLHVHSEYSLLDGAAKIKKLVGKAKKDGMKSLAITDHGNMYGVFEFVSQARKENIKPIVGCEFYLVADRHKKKFTREEPDHRYHQLLLAKNQQGYKNLVQLCSLGFIEGYYSRYPRIDKTLIEKYHEGLIATSCCLAAEIPQTILSNDEAKTKALIEWWKELFEDDFYFELQKHQIKQQDIVNKKLLEYASMYNIKTICTNDTHYVDKQDANSHDILLCINTNQLQTTPKFSDETESRKGRRFGFPNQEFYFKTQEQMCALFKDHPESIENTIAISDKVESYSLEKEVNLPVFPIPEKFNNQDEYFKHLCLQGFNDKYDSSNKLALERLEFEMNTIIKMKLSGYFLIVNDIIHNAKKMGSSVGPGRGSAAGSLAAYCLGITNIDPIKYDLLFERFLNPDRQSLPDIDTDFDAKNRPLVIDYMVKKYGQDQVAQIITYNRLQPKLAIRDVGRVLGLPLNEVNKICKYIPSYQNKHINLHELLNSPLEGAMGLKKKYSEFSDLSEKVNHLRKFYNDSNNSLMKNVLIEASKLEGLVRNEGIHAAGIIVAPEKVSNLVPVCKTKDSELMVTQFDGDTIQKVGVLKMDILGIKTLSIIQETLKLVEKHYPEKVKIDIDNIPLDDKKTFQLFKQGKTNGVFQFEKDSVKKYLRELASDTFEDLIAINALNRPGPIKHIPEFIQRKKGLKKIKYDLDQMQDILKSTYGITIYQEQVMLLSQKLANFSKGDADVLRAAMGKKKLDVLKKMQNKFFDGCKQNNHDLKICQKIWDDWRDFASYAFNKSHATCYTVLAFQTAYLKAHFPAEFMCSLLNNAASLEKISFFVAECKNMNINVLGPHINFSSYNFSVHNKNQIYYGLQAIKGMGKKDVESIISERDQGGEFKNLFDFGSRLKNMVLRKNTIELFVKGGAFDVFNHSRSSYFYCSNDKKNDTVIDQWLNFFNEQKKNLQFQHGKSLFAEKEEEQWNIPKIPKLEEWDLLTLLEYEKESLGVYFSGHPLDKFAFEVKNFTSGDLSIISKISKLNTVNYSVKDEGENLEDNTTGLLSSEIEQKELQHLKNSKIDIAVYISEVKTLVSKSGTEYAKFLAEDYYAQEEFLLFKEQYKKFKFFIQEGNFVWLSGNISQNKQGSWNFFIKEVMALETLIEDRIEDYTLKLMIPIKALNPDYIQNLKQLLGRQIKGKKKILSLALEIFDMDSNMSSLSRSRKFEKVIYDKNLFDSLDSFHNLSYRFEKK